MAGVKSTGVDVSVTLAGRLVEGRASRRVAFPLLELLVDEGKCWDTTSVEGLDRGEGLGRDVELTGRTESYLTIAMPRCCIAERKGSSGVSEESAFAQAVRHVYRVASTGWTEDLFIAKKRVRSEPEVLPGLLAVDCIDESRSGGDGLRP